MQVSANASHVDVQRLLTCAGTCWPIREEKSCGNDFCCGGFVAWLHLSLAVWERGPLL